jgi:4-carboxymuconolactone decarboxylase
VYWRCARSWVRGVSAAEDGGTLSTAIEASGLIGLDPKTQALTRVAAVIAIESRFSSYQWAIDAALEHGASEEDLIDVLLSIAPVVGLERATSAAAQLARLVGFACHPAR